MTPASASSYCKVKTIGKAVNPLPIHGNFRILFVYRPQDFLFPGRPPRETIAPNSVGNILRSAVAAVGIRKKVTPHTLRHSFATHLMELGVNMRIVQILLGHVHMNTTSLYTTVSSEHLRTIPSPLDVLATPKAKVLG